MTKTQSPAIGSDGAVVEDVAQSPIASTSVPGSSSSEAAAIVPRRSTQRNRKLPSRLRSPQPTILQQAATTQPATTPPAAAVSPKITGPASNMVTSVPPRPRLSQEPSDDSSGTGPGKRKRRPSTMREAPSTITSRAAISPPPPPPPVTSTPAPAHQDVKPSIKLKLRLAPVSTAATVSDSPPSSRPRPRTSLPVSKKSSLPTMLEQEDELILESIHRAHANLLPIVPATTVKPPVLDDLAYDSDAGVCAALSAEPDADADTADEADPAYPTRTPEKLSANVSLRLFAHQRLVSLQRERMASSASPTGPPPPLLRRGVRSAHHVQHTSDDDDAAAAAHSRRQHKAHRRASAGMTHSRTRSVPSVGTFVNGEWTWGSGGSAAAAALGSFGGPRSRRTSWGASTSARDFVVRRDAQLDAILSRVEDSCSSSADEKDDEEDFHQAMLDGADFEFDVSERLRRDSAAGRSGDADGGPGSNASGHASAEEANDTPATTPRSPQSFCDLPDVSRKKSPVGGSSKEASAAAARASVTTDASSDHQRHSPAALPPKDAVFSHALPSSNRPNVHAGSLTLSLPYGYEGYGVSRSASAAASASRSRSVSDDEGGGALQLDALRSTPPRASSPPSHAHPPSSSAGSGANAVGSGSNATGGGLHLALERTPIDSQLQLQVLVSTGGLPSPAPLELDRVPVFRVEMDVAPVAGLDVTLQPQGHTTPADLPASNSSTPPKRRRPNPPHDEAPESHDLKARRWIERLRQEKMDGAADVEMEKNEVEDGTDACLRPSAGRKKGRGVRARRSARKGTLRSQGGHSSDRETEEDMGEGEAEAFETPRRRKRAVGSSVGASGRVGTHEELELRITTPKPLFVPPENVGLSELDLEWDDVAPKVSEMPEEAECDGPDEDTVMRNVSPAVPSPSKARAVVSADDTSSSVSSSSEDEVVLSRRFHGGSGRTSKERSSSSSLSLSHGGRTSSLAPSSRAPSKAPVQRGVSRSGNGSRGGSGTPGARKEANISITIDCGRRGAGALSVPAGEAKGRFTRSTPRRSAGRR